METGDSANGVMKELQTRFLCPFFFRRDSVNEATKALLDVTIPSRSGPLLPIWECHRPRYLHSPSREVHAASGPVGDQSDRFWPHHHYQEELLDHVVEFLDG